MRPGWATPRRRTAPEGDLEVFGADEQSDVAIDVERWTALARSVLVAQGVHGDVELAVLFVDETSMAALNSQFMEVDEPTDVLAFPIDDDVVEMGRWPDASTTGPDRAPVEPDDAPLLLGDVVICPAVAARNAPEHAGTVEDELALLVVHGVLHVLGMDHAELDDRQLMQAKERELLTRFHGAPARDPWAEPAP
jgi:probable rRNA maturation factor